MNTKEEIIAFSPKKEYFVGIDSDGTAFDSMNIKHFKSMCPAALEIWNVAEHQEEFEKIWYHYNLYSADRGKNRFLGLLHALDALGESFSMVVDNTSPLRDFIKNGGGLSNDALKSWLTKHPSPMLDRVLQWSLRSDQLFEEYTRGLLPFANIEDALKCMVEKADVMVVSSASGAGLDKDWSFSGLTKYTSLIAGQETGTKKEQLKMAANGKYPPEKILMIGDAIGDLEAAQSIDALFFPIMPGSEEDSWLFLKEEALNCFFNNNYKGDYENKLVLKFKDFLS